MILVGRFDPRLLVGVGLVLTSIGNFGLSGGATGMDAWTIVWTGAISGAGMGLFFVPLSTVAFDRIEASRQDEASGLYGVMRSIGSSVGIAIVGWLLVSRTQVHWNGLVANVNIISQTPQAYLAPLGLSPTSEHGAEIVADELSRQAEM